jgi:DNA-binding CsgD family transcriptional regulator
MSHRITSSLFVGRVEELGLFEIALARAAAGEPGLVLVCGEAGVGKSRLLAEFAALAKATGATVTQGACVELAAGGLPYSPMVGALGDLARNIDQATFDWLGEPARAPLRRLVPELALPGGALEPAVNADTRPVLFESAAGLLSRLSADRALVLIIEDLHWADRSTLDLLRYLVSATRNCRLLLVAAIRTDQPAPDVEHAVAEFGRDPRVQRIDLGRLDRAETRALVEGILGVAPSVALLDRIYERSEGNPFFAEELLAAGPDASGLTPGLRQVALSRVLDLSEDAQKVVRVVAVAGRPLDHARLESLCHLPNDDLIACLRESVRGYVLVSEPGSDCYSFRHALVREVVYEDTLPGERRRIHLAHAVQLASGIPTDPATLAELAYHLDRGRSLRAAMNAYIAAGTAAETVSAYSEAFAHFERALALLPAASREPDDTVSLPEVAWVLEQTARNAYQSGDQPRAIELMTAAIAEVDQVAEPERAASFLERLAMFTFSMRRDTEKLVATMAEAASIVRDLPPSQTSARVLASWAHALLVDPGSMDAAAATRAALEALGVARAAGARAEEGRALGSLSSIRCLSDIEGGLAEARTALSVALEAGDIDSALGLYVMLAGILYDLGDFPRLASCLEQASALADQLGGAQQKALILFANLAQICMDTADWSRADSLVARAFGLAGKGMAQHEGHFPAARLAAGRGQSAAARSHLEAVWPFDRDLLPVRHATVRAEVLVNERRWPEARAEVEAGLAASPSLSATADLVEAGLRAESELAAIARLHRDEAGLAEAVASAERMAAKLDGVESAPDFQLTAWYRYARAFCAAEMSRIHYRPDPAAWRLLIDVAETEGMLYRTIYPRFRLAESLLETASGPTAAAVRVEAASELRRAHALAAHIGAQPLVDLMPALASRARISLYEAAATDRGTPLPIANRAEAELARLGLTPREIEVLAVVADGRTNRQIAEILFIAEKTAAIHVSHILGKLGAANRVEAAATAYRLGLSAHSADRLSS